MIHHRLWQIAGWTMLHYLWVGALLGLAVLVLKRVLRSAAANVRYLAALSGLLLLSAAPAVIAIDVAAGFLPSPAASVAATPRREVEPLPPSARPAEARATAAATPAPVARNMRFRAACTWAAEYLPWLWIMGAPLVLLLTTVGVAGAERLRRQSRSVEDARIAALCRELTMSLRIAQRVGVAVCNRVATPLLIGILRPTILLPVAALTCWDGPQLEMVLLHELAHVQRLDNLVNLLQRIIESALFFHPMVWVVSGWVRHEREHCCDELVVGRTHRPQAYAELLVTLAETLAKPRRNARPVGPAVASFFSGHPLVARIRRILKPQRQDLQMSRRAMALLIVGVVGLVLLIGGYCSLPGLAQDPALPRDPSRVAADAPSGPSAAEKAAGKNAPAADLVAQLGSPTQLEFIDTPLLDVVDYLKDLHHIHIEIDRNALKAAGMKPDLLITANLKGVTLESALRLILRQAGLTHIVRDNLLLITTPQQAAASGSDPIAVPVDPAHAQRIAHELGSPTEMEFIDTPLSDVVDYLKDYHKIEIQLDHKALKQAKIKEDDPISMNLKGIALQSALRLILRQVGLAYVVRYEVLLITTPEEAAAMGSDPITVRIEPAREEQISKALQSPTQMEFIDTPLSDAVDYLKDLHKIEIQLDHKALKQAKIKEDELITINVKGVPLRAALSAILGSLGLQYEIRDEVLLITTKK